ncbi:MAG: FAD-binding oxidoreductase [Crocinitomicaceae bacterium]
MIDTNFYSLKISNITKETEDTVSISFDVDPTLSSKFDFIPGQYLTLKAMINGEDIRRSYSISSGKGEGLRVAVKQIQKGVFSTYANQELKVGQEMEVMPPTGNFVLKNQGNGSISVFVAAGSGITPVLSMVKETLSNTNQTAVLIYGNKNMNSVIYKEEIEKLMDTYGDRLQMHYVISRDDSYDGLKGRINVEIVKTVTESINMSEISGVYLCGPEDMVKNTSTEFEFMGVSKDKIHFELFFVAESEEAKEAESNLATGTSRVTMIIDDEEFEFELAMNGPTILEAGAEAGADLPFGCKGGVCCTCKAKVMEGKAKMIQNYALDPDEVEQGFILTCQSHPESDNLVVSFDEY